jgi:thioredoxin-like negative regulator of GroEL
MSRAARIWALVAAVVVLAGAAAGIWLATRPNPMPKLVYFSTSACSACAQVSPLVDQAVREYKGLIEFERVSLLEKDRMEYYTQFQPIYVVPTIFLFNAEGELTWTGMGTLSYEQIVQEIAQGTGVARPG